MRSGIVDIVDRFGGASGSREFCDPWQDGRSEMAPVGKTILAECECQVSKHEFNHRRLASAVRSR